MRKYLIAKTPTLAVECQVCDYDCLFVPMVEGASVNCPKCNAKHVPGPDSLTDGARQLAGKAMRGGPGIWVKLATEEKPAVPPPAPGPAKAATASGCNRCSSPNDLALCTYCHLPVCPRCRYGTGSVSDGYTCDLECTLSSFLGVSREPAPPKPSRLHAWFQRLFTRFGGHP